MKEVSMSNTIAPVTQAQGLIFIAHGSRNPLSNDTIAKLVEEVREKVKNKYTHVNHAFLESTTPTLAEAITQQIQEGVKKIALFPYFLSGGNHVTRDIPAVIDLFKQDAAPVEFVILDAFGSYPNMAELITDMV